MVKLIIFDLGGVVTSPDIEYLDRSVADFLGLNISQLREITSMYKSAVTKGEMRLEDSYSRVILMHSLSLTPKEILEKHLSVFKEILSKLNQKTLSVIEQLRPNYDLVALANAEQEVIPIARELGLYSHFNKSYISCQMGMQKPDEEIYLAVLRDRKCLPQDAIFIDDKLENISGARKLGIKSIHHTPRTNLEEELKRFGVRL